MPDINCVVHVGSQVDSAVVSLLRQHDAAFQGSERRRLLAGIRLAVERHAQRMSSITSRRDGVEPSGYLSQPESMAIASSETGKPALPAEKQYLVTSEPSITATGKRKGVPPIDEFDRLPTSLGVGDVARFYATTTRTVGRWCAAGKSSDPTFVLPEPGTPRRWLKSKLRKVFYGSPFPPEP